MQSMVMNPTGQIVFIVFVMIPWVIFIAMAVRILIRSGNPVPILFLIGGAITIVWEPIVDVLGMVLFPVENQIIGLRTIVHRPVPMFMWPVYSWFVGGQALVLLRAFQRGTMTRPSLWKHWLGAWGVNIVLETPGILMGVYAYFGPQPFNLWGLPLWWPAVNATTPIAAAFIIFKLFPRLTGARILVIIPLLPMANGITNAAIAWPVWSALHSGHGLVVTHIAALIALGLATIAVWGFAGFFPETAGGSGATAGPDPDGNVAAVRGMTVHPYAFR